MRFNRPSFLQIISVFLLAINAARALDFPSTIDGFSFFLVFDTPILESGTTVDASRYNLVWGASDRIIPMYKATNPDITVAHYMPWSRDPDGTHDLAYWKATKPEWVLYQCDRKTPAYLFADAHMPLDISNPDVIDWQLNKYIEIVNFFNYNGIAADNFAVGNAMNACGIWRGDEWVQKYDGRWEDPNYTVDALNWITTFYAKLKSMAPEISFGINYSLNEMPPFDARVMSVVDHTDYVLDEAGFTRWGFGKPTPEKWEDISTWIDNIQSHGKHYFGINEFPNQVTDADNEWGMASYLMSKNHGSSMVNTLVQGYGRETYMKKYVDLKIGEPIGKRYVEGGLYKRKYSNGFVFVNVYNEDKKVTLPEDGFKYKDVFGNTYAPEKGSFTIKAQSGLVLGATVRPPTTTISTTTTTTGKTASTTGKASSSGSNPTPQNPASTIGFSTSGAAVDNSGNNSGDNSGDNSGNNSGDNSDSSTPVISGSGGPRPASTTAGGLEEEPSTSSSSPLSFSPFVIVFVCAVSMALLL